MNAQRRNKRDEIIESLEDIITEINNIRDEEEEALYNMPDSIQESERGEHMQENIDSLDTIMEELESQIEELRGVD